MDTGSIDKEDGMNNLFKRINGLIRIAEKREESQNATDKLIGRQVARNLKMAKKIIGEEIVFCGECIRSVDIKDAVDRGYITSHIALEVEGTYDGFCPTNNNLIKATDFCSRGKR